ncbi:hypothetical protein ASC87_06360 [Rhizobacter sp. Root1221]|nr:hypothetical protein ASC87_06360 [Rhizobacter sp. Root1221]
MAAGLETALAAGFAVEDAFAGDLAEAFAAGAGFFAAGLLALVRWTGVLLTGNLLATAVIPAMGAMCTPGAEIGRRGL